MSKLTNQIRAVFNPVLFHGWYKNKSFFEGWYYKFISANGHYSLAIIPGISIDEKGKKHAFIQLFDNTSNKTTYATFPFDTFNAHPKSFDIHIDNNRFTQKNLSLNFKDCFGDIEFSNIQKLTSKWYSPGVMGVFSFLPKMKCYHGVLNMEFQLSGSLKIKDQIIDFTGGKGYLEKDWGHSFPDAYLWAQCNHFQEKDTAISLSMARIKYLGIERVGFNCILKSKNKTIHFSTQNLSKIKQILHTEKEVKIVFSNKTYSLEITVEKGNTTPLLAPKNGKMNQTIYENINTTLQFSLKNKSGKIVINDIGKHAGLDLSKEVLTLNH